MEKEVRAESHVFVQRILTERHLRETCDMARKFGEEFRIEKDEQHGGWNFITYLAG